MRILIAEDDSNKIKHIADLLREAEPSAQIVEKRSYQSSLKEALANRPDVIVLDMSMPNYDLSPSEPGGRFRHYAGRDILREIKRKGLEARVVVVTQYESFGEGKEMMTLDQLKSQLNAEFPGLYVGTVFYRPSETTWRDDLTSLIVRSRSQCGPGAP